MAISFEKSKAKFLMAGLLSYAAVIQHNDPDPIYWMALYGLAAIITVLSMFKDLPRAICLALLVVSLIWAGTLIPGIVAASALTGTEEERELLGLLIVFVWSVILLSTSKRREPATISNG